MKRLMDTIKRICILAAAVAALVMTAGLPAGAATHSAGNGAVPIVCDGQETHG